MGVFFKMLLFWAVWCICLTACGSDSDSSSASHSESEESSEGDSSKVISVDAKAADAPVIWGKVQDNRTGDSLDVIQVGGYIWLTQNMNRKGWGTYSVCYDEVNSNCDVYGRHYQPEEAATACPAGFNVPSKNDWSWLSKFSAKHSEVIDAMKITYGGYCVDKIGSIECKKKDEVGKYLTTDGIAVFRPGSMSPAFEDAVKYGLYQLRCVAYTYIVATKNDLPKCDSVAKETLGPYFVVDQKSNYRCLGNRWEDDFNDSCAHVVDRTAVMVDDTLYICKDENWQVASIWESREVCDDKNDFTTLLFNGEHYICEDSSWRHFSKIEEKLGYCRDDLVGTIDTLKTKGYDKKELDSVDVYEGYYCDSTGWRKAVMTDYVGFCDNSRSFEEVEFNDTSFVCRNRKWDTYTRLENQLGAVCNPKRQGKIDSANARAYICDKNEWRIAYMEDIIGVCDSTTHGKEAKYGGETRYCTGETWRTLSDQEKELGKICDKPNKDSIVKDSDGKFYYCNGSASWYPAKIVKVYGNCDSTRAYETVEFEKQQYYCINDNWKQFQHVDSARGFCTPAINGKIDSTFENNRTLYFYCKKNIWVMIPEFDTKIGICDSDNEDEVRWYGDSAYVCKMGWKLASKEQHLGECSTKNEYQTGTYKGEEYICRPNGWSVITKIEKNHGICKADNCEARIQDGGDYYNCNCTSLKWEKISEELWDMGPCQKDTSYFVEKKTSWWYRCNNGSWTALTSPSEVYGSCDKDNVRTGRVRDKLYGCDPDNLLWMKWYALEDIDTVKGYCRKTMQDDTLFFNNSYYTCDRNSAQDGTFYAWREITIREYMKTCNTASEGKVMFNGFNESKCTGGKWTGITTETLTDSRDSKKYRVLTVDGVSWMVENLAYSTDSSWCIGSASNCSNGRLYAWTSAQKACPSGWRLPTYAEWNSTTAFLDSIGNKYSYYGSGWSTDMGDDDLYGLNITPTGFYESYMQNGADPMTTQSHTTTGAYFWNTSGKAFEFGADFKPDSSAQYVNAKILAIGVRCIK